MSRIFLDYAAITPIDPMVAKEMEKVQKEIWANPSSLHHEGEKAKNVLEEARIKIARILHCRANEVFFYKRRTESLNLAILRNFPRCHLRKKCPKGGTLGNSTYYNLNYRASGSFRTD